MLLIIPGNLQDFFHCMVQKIEKSHVSDATIMLNLYHMCYTTDHAKGFRLALTLGLQRTLPYASEDVVQSDTELEKIICSLCCGLLEVARPHLTVQLIHQTVIDFLLHSNGFSDPASDYRAISCLNGHLYMLRLCLQYLSISDLKSVPARVQESPESEKYSQLTTKVYGEFGLEYSSNKMD
jgi:hypothetical protein